MSSSAIRVSTRSMWIASSTILEHGLELWIDRDTDHGEQWPRVIQEKVDGCTAFVVVMTPASDRSDWVPREIVRAQERQKLILPLLLDDLPFFMLNTTQHEDVSDGRLPSPAFVKRLQHVTSDAPADAMGDDETTSRRTALDWYDEGYRLDDLGRREEAIAAYDRAIELDPNHADAHNNRGFALYKLGRQEEAIAAYDRAIELDAYGSGKRFGKSEATAGFYRVESDHWVIERYGRDPVGWWNESAMGRPEKLHP